MFKVTEVERKIKEINILTDIQINLSLCRTSDHYFSSSLPTLVQNFLEGWQIMAAEKMWLQKKSLEHNDFLYAVPVLTVNAPSPQN